MRHPGVPQRSCGPRPLGTSCHSPSKLGEKSKEASRTSPPWSGSGTGEYGRRPGGGASEASHETRLEFPGGPADRAPPALRAPPPARRGRTPQAPAAPPPPARWGRNPKRPVGRPPRGAAATGGTDDDFPRNSPPWSGSGTGEYRRRRGGGASEASQKTTLWPRRPVRTAPPRHFVPLPQQAGGEIQRGQSDVSPVERQRQGGTGDDFPTGLLPRGAAATGGRRR